ncbi:UDP-N-acetylglucosamine 2-epimerase (non-hydrolyzing) [Pseudomonas sp. JS3066]|uniref:non-hydrolyzing UDP-N-acetylglucosamine 2-epimerase n=1 Tax=Pseudomonas sp. JS3066 TaxID=3090665 RepID=UPI002E7B7F50|nr:UDP-N-acetylglucosamine 2-epimerase (non-hydrolyzing) [Pseudomonas sp. JS3066]WVK95004.1 UDP-N-acetylglucosamine 2-epimerase (non-hydrolyzing) [Pseudomonas sp. JS3066]
MKKVITIVGARPQFIKAAAVSRAFRSNELFDERILHTGQHFDSNMSDVFFDELDIPRPHFHLGIGGGGHGQNTGRMLEAIETVLVSERPDWVLVYGDTDSTLAGALAAVKLHIPLAHVEAGLRSFNKRMPEEINRRLTDHASDLLLAPNAAALKTLASEGISGRHVVNVGDVMYDAALIFGEKAEAKSNILNILSLRPQQYILATVHRQDNTDTPERLRNIFSGFAAAPLPVVLPLHPRTRQRINSFDIAIPGNVKVVDPLGYLDMVMLEKNAALVATDSGGVQKEAYFHRVPCLTLRDETEWTELVELGWNTLASPSRSDLASVFAASYTPGVTGAMPYGNGAAAEAILHELACYS